MGAPGERKALKEWTGKEETPDGIRDQIEGKRLFQKGCNNC